MTYLETLRAQGRVCCCDFHDTLAQCDEHLAKKNWIYEGAAAQHAPPVGWVLVPYGEQIPQAHRAFDFDLQRWLPARHCHSTMTPMWATPNGHNVLYATPRST